jgi:hypothetical protein
MWYTRLDGETLIQMVALGIVAFGLAFGLALIAYLEETIVGGI